jgi:hypothetical protein
MKSRNPLSMQTSSGDNAAEYTGRRVAQEEVLQKRYGAIKKNKIRQMAIMSIISSRITPP